VGSKFVTPISHSRSMSHSGVRKRTTFLTEINVSEINQSYYPLWSVNQWDFHGFGCEPRSGSCGFLNGSSDILDKGFYTHYDI